MSDQVIVAPRIKTKLTGNQKRSFWAAWGGWAMDGMDSFIYALVLVPAMRELLPKSGIAASPANVFSYGAILFAIFMVGWGLAVVWGPVADRFGRTRTLMVTILWFSVFTLLAATAQGVWSLAFYRCMAGIGIGGEWAIGAALVSEAWPEDRRVMGGGLMHTGYYFGFFLAALANYFIGSNYGWRIMFVVGGSPALLVAYFYNRVHEPERWQARQQELGNKSSMSRSFATCFQPEYRRRTILNSVYILASISGLWAGSAYVPAAITELARQAGQAAEGAKLASWSGAILAIGTILGAILSPLLAEWLGRRAALGIFFAMMLIFEVLAFGYVFYMGTGALAWFLVCTFFLGLGGASFAVYSFWLPEQYRTECRVSAFAFTTNVGRFAGAVISLALAWGIQHYGTLGKPVAITGLFFAVALLLLPFGEETKGKGLPT
jgi:MFS family permease